MISTREAISSCPPSVTLGKGMNKYALFAHALVEQHQFDEHGAEALLRFKPKYLRPLPSHTNAAFMLETRVEDYYFIKRHRDGILSATEKAALETGANFYLPKIDSFKHLAIGFAGSCVPSLAENTCVSIQRYIYPHDRTSSGDFLRPSVALALLTSTICEKMDVPTIIFPSFDAISPALDRNKFSPNQIDVLGIMYEQGVAVAQFDKTLVHGDLKPENTCGRTIIDLESLRLGSPSIALLHNLLNGHVELFPQQVYSYYRDLSENGLASDFCSFADQTREVLAAVALREYAKRNGTPHHQKLHSWINRITHQNVKTDWWSVHKKYSNMR